MFRNKVDIDSRVFRESVHNCNPYDTTAVVAEWLRRLTRNQFPSGSAGSSPADCDIFFQALVYDVYI